MHQLKADPHYLFDIFVHLYRMVFLMEVTPKGYRYIRVSEQGKRASSLPEDVAGLYLHEMYNKDVAEELVGHYDEVVKSRNPVYFMSTMNIETNTARFASSVLLPIKDDEGTVRYVLGITTNLSEEAEMKLLGSIEHIDYLTGMPNLMKIKIELEKLFAKEDRQHTSVIRLHINRFKIILSLQGVERAHLLIKDMTKRLAELLPNGSIIGRVDGEEFIAILPHTPIEDAYQHGKHLLSAIAESTYFVAETEFALSGCLGMSSGNEDAERVIMNASTALLEARQAGKQMIKVYEKDDYVQRYISEMTMEMELAKGLKTNELSVVYQPKVNSQTGAVHFEALVRWDNATLGKVSPEIFIKVAEKSRLIENVTDFVFERVCSDMLEYAEIFEGRRVAVNLSPALFNQKFIERLIPNLTVRGLTPRQFEFEITEHTLMQEPLVGIQTIDYLKKKGFRVQIDDFGVSYSSLNYLKMFDIDGIKIDRSFISQLDKEDGIKEYEIVKMMVSLAKKLGLEVTAEGVETEMQYRAVQRLVCDEVQGYFFSRPLPINQLQSALDAIICQHETLQGDVLKPTLVHTLVEETEIERLKAILRLEILDTPREERYDRITRLVSKTLGVSGALVSILTSDRQWIKSCQGVNLENAHLQRKLTFCDHVVTNAKSLVIEDVQKLDPLTDNPLRKGLGFYAGVPLITNAGHVIGTLCITDKTARSFDDEALKTLEDFGRWVMAEIELTEQNRAQTRRQHTLESLYEVTAIQESFTEKLKKIQEVLRSWMGYSQAIIFSTDPSYHVKSSDGDDELAWTEEKLKQIHDLTMVGQRTFERSELIFDGIEFTSMISLPLLNESNTFGWVVFLAERGDLQNVVDAVNVHEMIDTILLVTRWMENEIRREQKHQEVLELITIDGLTKLSNRHSFITDMKRKMDQGTPLALLFIDLDGFKDINDTYGHLVGDEVLVELANRLMTFSDMYGGKAYRFAGDEFLIVMEMAEEPLQDVFFNQLSDLISQKMHVSTNLQLQLSASIGVAYSDSTFSSIDELIHNSDAAMYVAKNSGGDGYSIYRNS